LFNQRSGRARATPLAMDATCSIDMSSNPDFYAFGYDNSVACWATNYILVAVILYCIDFLWRHKSANDMARKDEHTRYWLIGKYLLTAISVGTAGTVHQGLFGRAGDVSDGVNAMLWLVVEATLMLSGICMIIAAFAIVTKFDCNPRNIVVYFIVTAAGVCVCVLIIRAYGTDAFGAAGGIGEGIPDLVMLAILLPAASGCCLKVLGHQDPDFKFGAILSIIAILVIFAGAYVQVALGPACGNTCPADCPLPAPHFDHNALFHLAQAVGMALLAYGMDKTCRAMENAVAMENAMAVPYNLPSGGWYSTTYRPAKPQENLEWPGPMILQNPVPHPAFPQDPYGTSGRHFR